MPTAHDHPHPSFGGTNGLLYPMLARVLYVATSLAPPRLLNLSTTETDLYLVMCLLGVIGSAAAVDDSAHPGVAYAALAVAVWRIGETASVMLYEFCIRPYRGRKPNAIHRLLLLKLFNFAELIVAFGILYFIPARFGFRWMNHDFPGVIDAIYFSTVTAGTLGYGDYSPVAWQLKLLVMLEVLFFVLIGVTILGAFKGTSLEERRHLHEHEHPHDSGEYRVPR